MSRYNSEQSCDDRP
jgi:hypothetical protein